MIELRGVGKSFDGGDTFVVRELSLRVDEGELVCLLGESGCGKTTTLKMINRLVDRTTGAIEVDGADVVHGDPVALRRRIGYVFQRIGLFPHMTVAENAGVVPRLLGWAPADIAARVNELLAMVDLDPARFRDRRPHELSGGQQQRVGVVRALAAQPAIVLMDEPFGALDPLTRDALQQEYRRLHRDLSLTTVLVTHDMVEALRVADRIAVMAGGRIVQVGTPRELLTAPADDYVRRLMRGPREQAAFIEELIRGRRMSENLRERLAELPANLANHLEITVIALAVGVAASIPLAVLLVRRPRWRYPVLTTAGVIQTIPSLALLALMVPLLVYTGGFGLGLSAFGFWPAVIALTLYSLLPILRNTVTGIVGVDPALTEAARGVGMSPRQVLWQIELPLAAPVIIAGIRTATVWTVGIATLATPVGQTCLGNYIFAGLQTRNWLMVTFGVVAAAALAVILNLSIGGLERAASTRRRSLAWLSGGALAAIVIAGLASPGIVRWLRPAPVVPAAGAAGEPHGEAQAARGPIRIGAKTFTEQYILAELIRDALAREGVNATIADSLGSTVIFEALAHGDIDVYVDYSGTIWADHMKRADVPPGWQVLTEVEGWLAREHSIRSLGSLGFENAYALAMRRAQAAQLGIQTIADLADHAPGLRIGGDYEFFSRPEWLALRDRYALSFSAQASFDSTLMYEAIAAGQVNVISAFSSDGRIAAYDLLVLDDPRGVIPPYDAMLLLSPFVAGDERVVRALAPLAGTIPLEQMQRANLSVDRDTGALTPRQAAAALAPAPGQ